MTESTTEPTEVQSKIDDSISVANEPKTAAESFSQDAEPSERSLPSVATDANQAKATDHPNFEVTSSPKESKSAAPVVQDSPASLTETSVAHEVDPSCSISLQFLDCHGWLIPKLAYRVLDITNKIVGDTRPSDPKISNIKMIASGSTDTKGNATLLEGLTLGMRLEFQIKNDQGIYKLAAIDTVRGTQGNACLRSPKDKFTITTYSHDGVPGKAEKNKEELAKKHNQTKATEPNVSINANKNVKPSVGAKENNSQGNPIVAIKDGLVNMWGQNKNTAAPPIAGKTDLDKVNKLIEFATEQAATIDSGDISATIIKKMKDGVYKNGGVKKSIGYKNSIHHCAKYVKVALWAAGYSITDDGDIDSKAGLARELCPGLLRNGFTDVTSQLPDARWAAPGDIIVYTSKGDASAAGHIDIRTYDGYISDFIADYLPVRKFNVIGIYRKYYDPLPELRVKAFLKVIREWECHGISDEKRYLRLQNSLNNSMYFSDTSTHPYSDQPNAKGSFSGAYQIRYTTWKELVTKYGLPENFTPETQDMMAVSLLEIRHALGYIRKGEIREGIAQTTITAEWSSLPGGRDARHEMRNKSNYIYTIDDVIQKYNGFLKELVEAK